MSNFRIGEKVVCVSKLQRDEVDIHYGVFLPIQNEIYTIREIVYDYNDTAIRLAELINPILEYKDGFDEICFRLSHFRKLDYEFAENLLRNIKEEVMQLTE